MDVFDPQIQKAINHEIDSACKIIDSEVSDNSQSISEEGRSKLEILLGKWGGLTLNKVIIDFELYKTVKNLSLSEFLKDVFKGSVRRNLTRALLV